MADEARQTPGSFDMKDTSMPAWQVGELPSPPRIAWNPRSFIGPGLMMAGAAIGGGEWLMGPAVTAQYGGIVMWLAMVSIFFQVTYNLEIMRYTVYCGEPIIVGFFRLVPGPRFWTCLYLFVDFFGIWPYLAANAAVPLAAALLGHLPGALPTQYLPVEEVAVRFEIPRDVALEMKEKPDLFREKLEQLPVLAPVARHMREERQRTQRMAYGVFLLAFVPLVFGGKIYNALERLMVTKIIVVLGYLLFLGFVFVSPATWGEIFAGFIFLGKGADGQWGFRLFPDVTPGSFEIDWALLAAFAAIAGQGGMTNSQLSSYVRDKGWGMGAQVGAIPSMIGGRGITLSHTGKIFNITQATLDRWKGWMRVLLRDQVLIWGVGCILGVAIPALVSLEFVRGTRLQGDAVAAETARGIVSRTGITTFWFLTLICGFIILLPSQISQIDGIIRRWTDVLWTGSARLKHLEGHKVKFVYYGLLAGYACWGLLVLTWLPNPLLLTKFTGGLMNFALGFSALHTLAVNLILLPRELRSGWFMRLCLVGCGIFFITLSIMGLHKALSDLHWL